MSKRLSNGLAMAVFTDKSADASYLPCKPTIKHEHGGNYDVKMQCATLGLVAARTVVRALSLVTKPALATLNVCCSMAS